MLLQDPSSYFSHGRHDVRGWLREDGPVLDVGCGHGHLAAPLSDRGVTVHGIEPVAEAAQEARTRYDEVFTAAVEDWAGDILYAQIVAADVLEHTVDPWRVLSDLVRRNLRPGGRVVVSLPNVRHWRVVVDLALRGRWDYTDAGILDRTHLRFFTLRSAVGLVEGAGAAVVAVQPVSTGRAATLLPPALRRRLAGLIAYQWIVVGEKPS